MSSVTGKSGDDGDKLVAARLRDALRLAEKRNAPVLTDFLTPAQQRIALTVAKEGSGVRFALWGGYEEAERKRGGFFPPWVDEPDFHIAFLALETRGDDPAHPEILGALTGLGIRREKVGDILASARPPKIICDEGIVPFLTENFTKAGRKSFRAVPCNPGEIPQVPFEEKTFTVPSLRLDCVAAEGFGLSRTKTAEQIKGGGAFLNWEETFSPAAEVAQGDVISLRGHGKLILFRIGGVSRKDRIFITVHKYIK